MEKFISLTAMAGDEETNAFQQREERLVIGMRETKP